MDTLLGKLFDSGYEELDEVFAGFVDVELDEEFFVHHEFALKLPVVGYNILSHIIYLVVDNRYIVAELFKRLCFGVLSSVIKSEEVFLLVEEITFDRAGLLPSVL